MRPRRRARSSAAGDCAWVSPAKPGKQCRLLLLMARSSSAADRATGWTMLQIAGPPGAGEVATTDASVTKSASVAVVWQSVGREERLAAPRWWSPASPYAPLTRAGRVQDGVGGGAGRVAAGRERRPARCRRAWRSAPVTLVRSDDRRRSTSHQVDRARLEREIARRPSCCCRSSPCRARACRRCAIVVAPTVPVPASRAPAFTVTPLDDAMSPFTPQRTAVHGGRAGIGIDPRQRQRAVADLDQRAAGAGEAEEPEVRDDPADLGRQIVATDAELFRAEEIVARALDRAVRSCRPWSGPRCRPSPPLVVMKRAVPPLLAP